MCVIQGGIRNYVLLAGCASWTFQCIFLFKKLVVETDTAPSSLRYAFIALVIFVLPFVSVIHYYTTGSLGYSNTSIACFLTFDTFLSGRDLPGIFGPIYVMIAIGSLCVMGVIIKVWLVIGPRRRRQKIAIMQANTDMIPAQMSGPKDYGPITDTLILVRPAIIFVVVFWIIFVIMLVLRFRYLNNYGTILNNFHDWQECFFEINYTLSVAENSLSYKVCGWRPSASITRGARLFSLLASQGHCVILCMLDLREAVGYWWLKVYPESKSSTTARRPRFNSDGDEAVPGSVLFAEKLKGSDESEALFVEVEHFDLPEDCLSDKFENMAWGPTSGHHSSRLAISDRSVASVEEFT